MASRLCTCEDVCYSKAVYEDMTAQLVLDFTEHSFDHSASRDVLVSRISCSGSADLGGLRNAVVSVG